MEIVPGLTGSTDSFCHRKSNTPLGQRGTASQSPCLSACHVRIGVPKVQSPHRGLDCRLLRVGCLPPFIYLFILSPRGFVNTCEVGISTLPPSTTPFPSKGLGVKQRTPWDRWIIWAKDRQLLKQKHKQWKQRSIIIWISNYFQFPFCFIAHSQFLTIRLVDSLALTNDITPS